MNKMKFRIDVFKDNKHIQKEFEKREDALQYACNEKRKGSLVFWLELIECTGKYDIVREV